jgi:hypothetical protein
VPRLRHLIGRKLGRLDECVNSVVTAWSQTGHNRTAPDITRRTVENTTPLLRRTMQHQTTRRNTPFRGFDSPNPTIARTSSMTTSSKWTDHLEQGRS